ncbi:MAG: 3-hydroxyacyl-ACP dehydratase FabZ [Roseitalea sp.]|jgi:3-hydroxyacyl-[acyl-carrier-protein] dehydratase|nr:3-hydroxyacyl-ACP dehydratase FabZ [Roseitalea sp.]MBO6723673.1 3-hydroxyacyl-ACP dehydratase FabZ [Roseitalea sp.]MBO6745341.1 3-hydroxyacyl-ACP dehydratase FabZ [Roseitalea sp.]
MTQTQVDEALEAADLADILKALPHRYPMLLVDRIINIDGLDSAVGIKNVTFNEPHFAGHFPDNPIMPGVLIIEGLAQTAGAIGVRSLGMDKPALVYFMSIDKAKFRKPVVPGDVLEYHVKLIKRRGSICRYECIAKVAGETVAEAELTAMLSPNDAKRGGGI